MWQVMAGFNYSVTDNMDLFIDYRYRSVSVNHAFWGPPPGRRTTCIWAT